MMADWCTVPSFGMRPDKVACVIRPSAYGLVEDDSGRLAVVRTRKGAYLPGGGIEAGETPREAIQREALEECGLILRLGEWTVRAIQFVYAETEKTHFEKRGTFIEGVVVSSGAARLDTDHDLLWVNSDTAMRLLSHESQRWAVEHWTCRVKSCR